MTRDEIIACLQALSRIEGATFAEQFKNKNTFISENIDYIAEKLIQLLKGRICKHCGEIKPRPEKLIQLLKGLDK